MPAWLTDVGISGVMTIVQSTGRDKAPLATISGDIAGGEDDRSTVTGLVVSGTVPKQKSRSANVSHCGRGRDIRDQ